MTDKIKLTKKFSLDTLGAKVAVKAGPRLPTWQKIIIAFVIGAVLALSGPGFDQWWLAWFMVAPFLVLLTFCHKNQDALFSGLFFGLGYHLVSLHYYLALALAGNQGNILSWQMAGFIWIFQSLALSIPTVIFAWLFCFLPFRPGYVPYYKRPFFSYLLSVPILWIFLHWGLSIAWPMAKLWQFMPLPPIAIDPLAYSQYSVLEMLQLLKYMGPGGLEFLLLLVNAAIAALFIELVKSQERPVERVDLISPRLGAVIDMSVALIVVAIGYGIGHAQIASYLHKSNELTLENNPNTEIGQPILPIGLVRRNYFLSEKDILHPIEQQLALIVFSQPGKETNFDKSDSFLKLLSSAVKKNKNAMFFNFLSKDSENIVRHNLVFAPPNSLSITQQISYPEGFSAFSKLFHQQMETDNMSFLCKLSPALKEWLFVMDKDNPSSWYSLAVPKIAWGKVGLLSGSDISNSRLVANEVRRGASLIVSSTDLSWTHNRCLNKQLLAAAIFRAIENNRYVLLSTNNGLLSIIEPNGFVQELSFANSTPNKHLQSGMDSLLLGSVQFLWSKTPFTKMWWL